MSAGGERDARFVCSFSVKEDGWVEAIRANPSAAAPQGIGVGVNSGFGWQQRACRAWLTKDHTNTEIKINK